MKGNPADLLKSDDLRDLIERHTRNWARRNGRCDQADDFIGEVYLYLTERLRQAVPGELPSHDRIMSQVDGFLGNRKRLRDWKGERIFESASAPVSPRNGKPVSSRDGQAVSRLEYEEWMQARRSLRVGAIPVIDYSDGELCDLAKRFLGGEINVDEFVALARVWDGDDYSTIAPTLGITEQALRKRISRARDKIQHAKPTGRGQRPISPNPPADMNPRSRLAIDILGCQLAAITQTSRAAGITVPFDDGEKLTTTYPASSEYAENAMKNRERSLRPRVLPFTHSTRKPNLSLTHKFAA